MSERRGIGNVAARVARVVVRAVSDAGATKTDSLPRRFAWLLFALPFVSVAAAGPDAAEIARLVRQLGDNEFAKREAASRRLAEIGEPALGSLRQARNSDDSEVRRRAEELVEAIEGRLLLRGPLCFEPAGGELYSVALSPDGRFALSGGSHAAHLWDARSGKELRRFVGHSKSVTSVACSPDSRRMVSGSEDSTVRLWDLADGRELQRFEGHKEIITGVAFSPCGRHVLSGSHDATVRLWDTGTGKELRRLKGHTAPVWGVAISPDGRRGLSCAGTLDAKLEPVDCTARVWDLETGNEVCRFAGHGISLMAAAFTPDGRRALSAGFDGVLWLWDAETGKGLRRFTGHGGSAAMSVAFSPDGKKAVSGSWDSTVRIWDVETGKELHRFAEPREVISVAFSSDGRFVLSGGFEGAMRLHGVPK